MDLKPNGRITTGADKPQAAHQEDLKTFDMISKSKHTEGSQDELPRPLTGGEHQHSLVGTERELWSKKIDFILSVVGFSVDLSNVWRFPYICYRNGGGAFLIPYTVMLLLGGLPLFYMELAMGQLYRSGCISIWKDICPMFKGIGFAILLIGSYVAMYYNTIIAWGAYYFFASFQSPLPWASCNNSWNTGSCFLPTTDKNISSSPFNYTTSPAEEYFGLKVLELHRSSGIDDLGNVKWSSALCLMLVFLIVYFSLWKGVKSTGKAVWITATLPYVVLVTLLIRGLFLPGAFDGIVFYLTPRWDKLLDSQVWIDAAAQTFFSLGPGFGVLMAFSSYNKPNNNCYHDALLTSTINFGTSFLAGFVVFSTLGYMSHVRQTSVDLVAQQGVGLVFFVYPEAIATLGGSSFWSLLFFAMLVTLGLDSTFGGLEALITGICDQWPVVKKRREIFVALLILYCFFCSLPTVTYGGSYVITLLDSHGAQISILLICFFEAAAVSWFYGIRKFVNDVEKMIGFRPGIYWITCWAFISPVFLLMLFILSIVAYQPVSFNSYRYPDWAIAVGWIITLSSIACVPLYMIYLFLGLKGSFKMRLFGMIRNKDLTRIRKDTTSLNFIVTEE